MTATVLPFQVFEAPEHWRTVDFISDLHLQDKDPATFEVWQRYMRSTAADAVFVLGDLFEVWVGDDAAAGFPTWTRANQVAQYSQLVVVDRPGVAVELPKEFNWLRVSAQAIEASAGANLTKRRAVAAPSTATSCPVPAYLGPKRSVTNCPPKTISGTCASIASQIASAAPGGGTYTTLASALASSSTACTNSGGGSSAPPIERGGPGR